MTRMQELLAYWRPRWAEGPDEQRLLLTVEYGMQEARSMTDAEWRRDALARDRRAGQPS